MGRDGSRGEALSRTRAIFLAVALLRRNVIQ
jgi:hypothetical protein